MTNLLTFPSPGVPWTSAEQTVLDRLGRVFAKATECECGTTDEGDPWIVFCGADSSFVAHVARIGTRYVMIWADGTSAYGADINRLLISALHRSSHAA